MSDVQYVRGVPADRADIVDFAPNDATHPAFGAALRCGGGGAGGGVQLPCDAGQHGDLPARAGDFMRRERL